MFLSKKFHNFSLLTKITSHFAVRENGDDCWCQLRRKKNSKLRMLCTEKQQQQNQNNFQERRKHIFCCCRVAKRKNEKKFPSTQPYTQRATVEKKKNFIQTMTSRETEKSGESIKALGGGCSGGDHPGEKALVHYGLSVFDVCMCENCHYGTKSGGANVTPPALKSHFLF